MPADLRQSWPAPTNPKPIVIIGAGGIIRNGHMPAYKQAELLVSGVTDVDQRQARALANDYGLPNVYTSVVQAANANGTSVVYDIATPPHVITDILPDLPDKAAVLIQKPMGVDQDQARKIRQICRDKKMKGGNKLPASFLAHDDGGSGRCEVGPSGRSSRHRSAP